MGSEFSVYIHGNSPDTARLTPWLPPTTEFRLVHRPLDALGDDRKSMHAQAILALWIDDNLVRWIRQQQDFTVPTGVVALGNRVSAGQALHLGQAGVQEVFDLQIDGEKFSQYVLEKYAAWKAYPPEPKTSVPIDQEIIGECASIRRMRNLIRRIAHKERVTVLIRGETGTGKELVAKAIHRLGPRSQKPFVEINCTAIPDTLVEAELFGHERGAFTDAHKSRKGIFELAHGGTLFLDEIGFLKKEVQVKLLKVLEEKSFRRVGGEKDIQVDCRVITGTSVNLEEQVANGQFRADLFYRLNVFPIHVPGLKDRGSDILLLAEHFREYYSREHTIKTGAFTPEARQFLLTNTWNGNVRELKHAVERAVILCENEPIPPNALQCAGHDGTTPSAEIFAPDTADPAGTLSIPFPETGKSMEEIESEIIVKVLHKTGGNKSEAARLLQISRSRLLRKIHHDDAEE